MDAAAAAFDALPAHIRTTANPIVQPYAPVLAHQLEGVGDHRPAMLTFHFGIPDVCNIEEAPLRDIAVGITATCPAEAQRIEAAGADFVVAQGWGAGVTGVALTLMPLTPSWLLLC